MKKINGLLQSNNPIPVRAIGSARGQAFEAYRVLIAVIIGLAVLLIILSAISYFDALRQSVSVNTLYSSWKSAVDSPNGKVVRASSLSFTKDTRFSRTQFTKQVGLEEGCLSFDADSGTGFKLDDSDADHPFVTVTGPIIGSVYMQCQTDNFIIPPGPSSCFAYCLMSFGKAIVGNA